MAPTRCRPGAQRVPLVADLGQVCCPAGGSGDAGVPLVVSCASSSFPRRGGARAKLGTGREYFPPVTGSLRRGPRET